MRSITGQENAVLTAPDGHSVAVRVLVWDGSAYQDVAALEERNWLVSVRWDESVDDPSAEATVELRRRLEDYSLNPLVSNKLTGVLALGRPFIIQTATIPLGDSPAEEDYREVFRGVVETLAMDKDPLVFTGRDAGGPLLRAYIEVEREYGSGAGVAVEAIIQSILTDNSTGVTLYVRNALGGTTTGAVFGKFKQKKMAVLTAIRAIALKIGWDLRYVWHDGTSTWRLTLIQPDRAATASSWTFAPSKVKGVTKLTQTLFDVRNVIKLFFYNRSVLDASGKPTLDDVTAEDATSISTYGRQYMQLAEDEDSPIDSASEAQTMANAARDDLKNPLLEFGVDVGFHYALQLGDLVTFEADDLHFSSNQTLAIIAIAHRIDARGHRTSLSLRGSPVAANDAWLTRDGRVRLLQQPPTSNPDPVTALTATATAGGAVITFAEPTAPPFPVEYELHIGTASGFTASSSTRREVASRTNFEVSGLTPGTTYYAQVVGRDKVGNRSAAVETSFSPRYVEPRALQPYVVPGIIPNESFEAHNNPDAAPDTWELTVGTWNLSAVITSTAYSGNKAVMMVGSLASELRSQPVTAREGDVITYEVMAMRPTAGSTPITSIYVEWLSDAFAVITAQNALIGNGAAGAWTRTLAASVAPTGTRFLRIRLTHSALAGDAVIVDSVRALYSRFAQEATSYVLTPSNGYALPPSAYEKCGYYMSVGYEVVLQGAIVAPSPAPAAGVAAFTLPDGYRPFGSRGFGVMTTSGAALAEVYPNGVVTIAAAAGARIFLDGIRFRPAGM